METTQILDVKDPSDKPSDALREVLGQLHDELARYLLARVREAKKKGEGLTSVDAKAAFDLIRHNKITDGRPKGPTDQLTKEDYPFDPSTE